MRLGGWKAATGRCVDAGRSVALLGGFYGLMSECDVQQERGSVRRMCPSQVRVRCEDVTVYGSANEGRASRRRWAGSGTGRVGNALQASSSSALQ